MTKWVLIMMTRGWLCQCTQVGPLPPPMSIQAKLRLSNWEEQGLAAYYGEERHGLLTASGEVFNMNDWTAAHPTLPFGGCR